MLWGSIRRRCLSANQSVRYAAVSLAGLLAAYLLLRVSYPPPPAGVPSCAGGWAEFRVAANCNAVRCRSPTNAALLRVCKGTAHTSPRL